MDGSCGPGAPSFACCPSVLPDVPRANVLENHFEPVGVLVSLGLDAEDDAAFAHALVVDLRPVLGDARADERARRGRSPRAREGC